MAKRQSKSKPTWVDVKAKLVRFDRAALLNLVQNLYAAHKNNQAFLHARLGLGEDALEPYKKTIDRWLWPDVFRHQDTSVSKAKQAISDYKKALGDPEGMAELMVFYCERATGFSKGLSHDDAGYFDALVRMFEQALKTTNTLAGNIRIGLFSRLNRVRNISHEFGYGVRDDMDVLFSEFVPSFRHKGASWK
jgi:tetratricopeptide (TPR) repeat protein